MATTFIRNETPSLLTLTGAGGKRLILAPLQEKAIDDKAEFNFKEMERAGIVYLHKYESRVEKLLFAIIIVSVYGFIVIGVASDLDPPPFGFKKEVWAPAVWAIGLAIFLVLASVLVIYSTGSFLLILGITKQVSALTVILAIGLALPAMTIYFFGGGRELLIGPHYSPLALFGRILQLSFIAVASLLPVLLFFLFDRFQLGTLRKRLYRNIFRLDRTVNTISEIDAKYGSQIREAYGPEDRGRARLDPGSRWPVLVCAFVVTVGWIVALAPVGADYSPSNGTEVVRQLVPQSTTLVFGFLGVYFYSLRMIAIRYARGDLKPKAYTHIIVRIFIVAILSWVLHAVFSGESRVMLLLAFLFGITPDEFFTWVRVAFRDKLPQSVIPNPSKLPLNDLEGIDLYDLGRLESEGIVNIEGLAHHELVDLIIETRAPVPRLIDWIDQAILYLHVIGGSESDVRTKLRTYGIRTATDLLRAWDQAEERGELDDFKNILAGSAKPYRLEVIRDTLLDDEWMKSVIWWREDTTRDPIEANVSR